MYWKSRIAKTKEALGALNRVGGSQWGMCPGGGQKDNQVHSNVGGGTRMERTESVRKGLQPAAVTGTQEGDGRYPGDCNGQG